MKKTLQKQNAITLIALVVTIIVLLILAGISITMLTGQNGILNRAGEAKEKTDTAQNDENNKLTNYENIMNMYGSGDNYVPIEDISDEIDGLPEKKTAEQLAGYIPIYTKEQFAKIASGETCAITDLSGNSKGSYTMAVDAKYALMNDLDFQNGNLKPIGVFKGEFEGNGCTITNVVVDSTLYTYVYENGGTGNSSATGLFQNMVDGKVSNLAVTNSTFISDTSVATIVGRGNNTTIENCYSKNNIISFTGKHITACGGIIGYVQANGAVINNCKVINSKALGEKIAGGFGGICGASEGDITINNCKYLGNGLDDNQISAGVIDCAGSNVNISNCSVQKINAVYSGIISKRTRMTSQSYNDNLYNLNISNCTVKDMKGGSAGIIAISAQAVNKISNCKVENIKSDASDATGGIAGCVLSDCSIENCSARKIEGIRSSRFGGMLGDFLGCGTVGTLNIKNCNVEDVNLSQNRTSGGIVGVSCGETVIQNCKVNNVKCDDAGVYSDRGGIVANICENRDGKEVRIEDCYVNNLNVIGLGSVGGIVGYGEGAKVDRCIVTNSKMVESCDDFVYGNGGIVGFLANGKISNCTTKNVDLKNVYGRAGGILGGTEGSPVENCNVYGGSIIDENTTEGIGGICGYGTNVSNCTVEGLKIEAPNTIGVAGIVGHGKNEVSTSLIQNCSIKNCQIKGKNYVGGIAGAAFINISNCQVEGSTLEGTDGVGGIQGFGGEFTDATKYVPIKIDKGEVTNTEIKGTTNVNNIQGCNTYVKDSTETTKDTITNCKYNGNSVTQ